MRKQWYAFAGLSVLAVVGCAAGPGGQWAEPGASSAGFWAGLWHGAIMIVTLIVSFFTDQVSIYEAHNSGVWYNIGFVLGVLCVSGNGFRATAKRKKREPDWDELADRIERKIKLRIEHWVEEDKNWSELGEQIQSKIKEKIKRWIEEDE
jgi:hypothetical protein